MGSGGRKEGGEEEEEEEVIHRHAPVTPTRPSNSQHHLLHHHHHQSLQNQPGVNASWPSSPAANVGPWPQSPSASRTPGHRSRTPSTPSVSSRGGSIFSPTERSRRSSGQEIGSTQIGLDHAAEGVKGPVPGLYLLHTGEILNEPLTQDHPLLTEDRLEEQQNLMLNATASSRGSVLRAKLSGGLRALKSDMAAFQAANPGSSLEDFVRWYSPRDWLAEEEDPEEVKETPAGEGAKSKVKGRLSGRMATPGNAWVECWKNVVPVPAHKQKKLFDFEKEAERALHDLETMAPSAVVGELLNCAFMSAFHTLHSALDTAEVNSVSVVLSRVKHLLWCSEDLGRPLDSEYCAELCTAFALAERQVTKAASLIAKLNHGVGALVDLLCTSGRANIESDEEKERLFSLACGGAALLKVTNADDYLSKPQAREYVCRAYGASTGSASSQLLFVRTAPDLFRIATSSTTPAV